MHVRMYVCACKRIHSIARYMLHMLESCNKQMSEQIIGTPDSWYNLSTRGVGYKVWFSSCL